MKYAAFLCGALALAASCAHADYVCEVTMASPAFSPTHGAYGEIQLVTSPQPNCGGSGKPFLICSKGATDTACGVHAQFSEVALNTLFETLHDAQMNQQDVLPQMDLCNGLGNSWSCNAGVMFRGP